MLSGNRIRIYVRETERGTRFEEERMELQCTRTEQTRLGVGSGLNKITGSVSWTARLRYFENSPFP